ncbi:VCBS repeat-containing protein, partial [bacterium]
MAKSGFVYQVAVLWLQTLVLAGCALTQNVSFIARRDFVAGVGPVSVAVGDFNGDGRQDLAVANANSNNVSVLLGNGDRTFQVAVNFGAGVHPFSVAVG